MDYLRSWGRTRISQQDQLGFASDVCKGMVYLEAQNLVATQVRIHWLRCTLAQRSTVMNYAEASATCGKVVFSTGASILFPRSIRFQQAVCMCVCTCMCVQRLMRSAYIHVHVAILANYYSRSYLYWSMHQGLLLASLSINLSVATQSLIIACLTT